MKELVPLMVIIDFLLAMVVVGLEMNDPCSGGKPRRAGELDGREQAMADSVQIEVNGKTYRGAYTVDAPGDTITVTHDDRKKTVKLGGLPSAVALLVLRELVTGNG